MNKSSTSALAAGLALALGASLVAGNALGADAEAAKTLARQSGCFKCHGVEKAKDGPAWHDVSVKYVGKPDAEKKLIYHITSGEKVKFADGHEEEHKIIKSEDQKEIKNLVDWILSLASEKSP